MPSILKSSLLKSVHQVGPYTGSIAQLVADLKPAAPLYLTYPGRVAANVARFLGAFPGTTMYAVKCNPDRGVLTEMIRAGLRTFDCASIDEIRLVRKVAPRAKIYFMHPVKAREAIREAYFKHNVRAFVLDCADELYKILHETDLAGDLELFVRVAIPKGAGVGVNLSGKFGAAPDIAAELLRLCRPVATKLGVSFHVGSQCTDTMRYAFAVDLAARAIAASDVKVEMIDVGGGFPMNDGHAPALQNYVDAIIAQMHTHGLADFELLCEPGRALVADTASLVVRVEQRRGDRLYINDGVYGNLVELGPSCNLVLPHQLIRIAKSPVAETAEGMANKKMAFSLAGPTCDSYDMMAGPFTLPIDAREGDYIQIDMIGAYGTSSQTRFNGFGAVINIAVN